MSLLRCPEHGYTLGEACPACGKPTTRSGPAKYSPEDPYGQYRRRLRVMEREKRAREASP